MAYCEYCNEWCPDYPIDESGIAVCEDCDGEINRQEYKAYLLTDHWASVRRRKLFEADFKCEKCGRLNGLQVHHKTYFRRGAEEMKDLEVLCNPCHKREHGRNTHK